MTLYLALGLCAVLAALLVYRYDLHEREPWYMLVLMFVVGAGGMQAAAWTETAMLNWIGDPSLVEVAMVAAVHEEVIRLVIVGLLALLVARQFNDPIDGVIYGSAVATGMAVWESIHHMRYLPALPSTLPGTELVRLMGHIVLGGITCYGIGLAKMRIPAWRWVLPACVAFAMTWHFLWDWMAFSSRVTGYMTGFHKAVAISLMLTGIVTYGVLVIRGSDYSRRQFDPHSTKELWGWPFSVWRREGR